MADTGYRNLVESQYSGRISQVSSEDSIVPTHDASASGDHGAETYNSHTNNVAVAHRMPGMRPYEQNLPHTQPNTQHQRHSTTTNLGNVSRTSSSLSDNSSTQHFIHDTASNQTRSSKWHHVKDLDSFFKAVYDFHQGHGFFNIVLRLTLELLQFTFTVCFVIILTNCINYHDIFLNKWNATEHGSATGDDWHRPWSIVWDNKCAQNILNSSIWAHLFMFVAVLCFLIRTARSLRQIYEMFEIRQFYLQALGITDVGNCTWYEIQKRVLETQKTLQLCIHKEELSELDVYNRILRYKNYMVAMANKNIIPAVELPVLGKTQFLSHSLKFNYSMLFFNSPISVFENSYKLCDEYKIKKHRRDLAQKLARKVTILALINLLFCPFIFLWQLIYSFFTYVEMAKREPDVFGKRRWTEHTRLRLRHFNELEHEFNARLARAYRPATKYFNCFQSNSLIIVAEHFSFIFGALLAVMIVMTVYDEDVLKIEHALTVMGALTAIVGILRGMIPADDELFCPEELLRAVLTHVHYLPATWNQKAHTEDVRAAFDKMFQLRALYIAEELLSPFITPYILYFKLRPKALEIVDFFRCYTIDVQGVGDVCSFATMDLLRHGDPVWNRSKFEKPNKRTLSPIHSSVEVSGDRGQRKVSDSSGSGPVFGNSYDVADQGKTEKSLLHFKAVNPNWRPQNVQVADWVNSNLYRRRADVDPRISEIMASQSTYNYLSVTKRSLGVSSRDMPISSRELYGMNASVLKLHDSVESSANPSISRRPDNENNTLSTVRRVKSFRYEEVPQSSPIPRNRLEDAGANQMGTSMEMSAFKSQISQ